MQRFFFYLFAILFFFTPLIIWPQTSEVFEFNKIVFVYTMTVIISASWIVRCIIEKKIILRRTILDYPLLAFLGINLLSTLFSIDPRTSWLGYYSRFNGGMLSLISYALLYWAYVSNMNYKSTVKVIFFALLSAALVSVYGVLEHFGIDKDIWVQDVQNRVFSTLGQPNWLAAFLLALIPLTWTDTIKKPYSYLLSALFFITLLFTKSRSGLLGFGVASIIFWGLTFIKDRKKYLKDLIVYNSIFLILFLVVGNPFGQTNIQTKQDLNSPALETGGTESGTIRKIVWKGAVDIWAHYPILGSGPETFGYAYYNYRPVEHNLVSEWDFIYNKAHNEYLNILANTGTLGIISYLVLIFYSLRIFVGQKRFDLLAGYTGLLVSNFFGFSVVPTQLILFLFPAVALIKND
jgi:O-antigen ligase